MEEAPPYEEVCDKKELRMQKNRMSAAKSRKMKREYIEHLETRVAELSNAVVELQKENWYWRSLDMATPNEVLHAEWCV